MVSGFELYPRWVPLSSRKVFDRTVLDRNYRQVANMFNLTTNDVVTMHS